MFLSSQNSICSFKVKFQCHYTVLMCKIGVKYQYANRAVCSYPRFRRILRIRSGYALIRACALRRSNTVYPFPVLYGPKEMS